MSTTETVTEPGPKAELSPGLNRLFGTLAGIERLGNKLPHPFWLFWILSGVLAVVSFVMAGRNVSVQLPGTDKTTTVENLLSMEGLSFALGSALDNFAGFPALPV